MFNAASNNNKLISTCIFQTSRGETISHMDAHKHKTNQHGDDYLSNQKVGNDNES